VRPAAAALAGATTGLLALACLSTEQSRALWRSLETVLVVTGLCPLVEARGVSGHEGPVREVVLAGLREQGYGVEGSGRPAPVVDESGNVVLTLGTGAPRILFVAHLDEVGFEVSAIRADGLLETRRRGGLYPALYQASAMELVTSAGVLPAISLPADGEAPGEVVLDVGARSAEEARGLGVELDDPATVPKELRFLGWPAESQRIGRAELHLNGSVPSPGGLYGRGLEDLAGEIARVGEAELPDSWRAAGRSLDDRVGCAVLLSALAFLRPDGLDRTVVFAWVTREETGLEGSDELARRMEPTPDAVFAVDTFVTSDGPLEDPYYAYAPLGGGPVLRALDNSSVTPRAALEEVRAIAAAHEIPLQTGTMGGGNDGSRFVPEGAIDCPLAWPQRSSHSRVETVALGDLGLLTELVAAVARDYGSERAD
jgi:putative aminopeptidase FrvX